MKRLMCIETRDGTIHRTLDAAKRHAEARYADALCSLGRELARAPYREVLEILDRRAAELPELLALKEDRKLNDAEWAGEEEDA